MFVDDSGRRSRWAGWAGAVVTLLCAAYIGVVVFGLSQIEVGPLLAVPAGGNGQVAGFPNAGTVPGLLATGGIRATRSRPAAPVRKASTTAPAARKARTTAPAPKAAAAKSTATTARSAESTAAPRSAASTGSTTASTRRTAAAPPPATRTSRSATTSGTSATSARRTGAA